MRGGTQHGRTLLRAEQPVSSERTVEKPVPGSDGECRSARMGDAHARQAWEGHDQGG